MLIARNTVVTLKYNVCDCDGGTIDEGTNPLVYLHGGYGGIFDRIEEELQSINKHQREMKALGKAVQK